MSRQKDRMCAGRPCVGADRSAYSLIEMLVVLIIVGVLIAITIPAVQRSRESARRAQCIHNQAQLATAIHANATQVGHFPGYRASVGDPGTVVGWAAQIFHELGRNDVDPTQPTYIEVLVCPSNQGPTDSPRLNYVVNGGQGGANANIDSPADGIFFDHTKPVAQRVYMTRDDFVDGLSNTIMISENLDATSWDDTTKESQCILWPLTAGNEVNNGTGARPSSHHPGGFVAAFADGSVKFMQESELNDDANVHTNESRYVALLTPGGADAPDNGGGPGGDDDDDVEPSGWQPGLLGEYRHEQPPHDLGEFEYNYSSGPTYARVDEDLRYPFGAGNVYNDPQATSAERGHNDWLPPEILALPGVHSSYWDTGNPNNHYDTSVRWSGWIKAEQSESYQFHVVYDDSFTLIVDGQTVYQGAETRDWKDQVEPIGSPVSLTAGQWVPIEVFTSDYDGFWYVRLLWSSASTPLADIPSASLRTDGTPLP